MNLEPFDMSENSQAAKPMKVAEIWEIQSVEMESDSKGGVWYKLPGGQTMIYVDKHFNFHCWIAPNFLSNLRTPVAPQPGFGPCII